jgi:hypothetical protein
MICARPNVPTAWLQEDSAIWCSKRWQSHFTPLTIGDSKSRISDQDASPVSECSPLATVTNANPPAECTRG